MRIVTFIIVFPFVACSLRPQVVSLHVVTAQKDAIVVRVRNDTEHDVVMLSPDSPSRQVDGKRCTVSLSTKVDDRVRPFAFTPRLITIQSGTEIEFRAAIHPYKVSTTCREWIVTAEYAYIRPEDVERFAGKASEDFRGHVLRNQQIVTTTASVRINS